MNIQSPQRRLHHLRNQVLNFLISKSINLELTLSKIAFFGFFDTFIPMNRDALWKILGLRGVPPKLINLMSELYSGMRVL